MCGCPFKTFRRGLGLPLPRRDPAKGIIGVSVAGDGAAAGLLGQDRLQGAGTGFAEILQNGVEAAGMRDLRHAVRFPVVFRLEGAQRIHDQGDPSHGIAGCCLGDRARRALDLARDLAVRVVVCPGNRVLVPGAVERGHAAQEVVGERVRLRARRSAADAGQPVPGVVGVFEEQLVWTFDVIGHPAQREVLLVVVEADRLPPPVGAGRHVVRVQPGV